MSSIIFREATLKDQQSVQALARRNGLIAEQSYKAWEWIWEKNRYYNEDWPLGWVLESNKNIVGFIGNIPRAYTFEGKCWRAGVARALVVDKDFRNHTLKLADAFFKQRQVDILIFSGCNRDSAAVYSFFHAKKIPQPEYNRDLFWIVSPASFVFSLLRKIGLGGTLSWLFAKAITPFIYLEMFFRKRFIGLGNFDIDIISPEALSKDINQFWEYLQQANPNRFLSYRDLDSIKWQFANDSAATRKPKIFTARSDGVLCGYAIVTRWDSPKYELKRIIINDLIVREDDPNIIRELVRAVFLYAKGEGVALIQIIGFPSPVRSAINSLHPFVRKIPYYPFWYHVINPELAGNLDKETAWYASTFDGDSSI